MAKLWGGRFSEGTDKLVEEYTASHQYDRRLYREDIKLNTAYSKALLSAGVLTKDEQQKIEKGLSEVQKDIEACRVEFDDSMEDIHTHIEYWLTKKIGEPAKKLHTGKSRNDQVATDLRLYLMQDLPIMIAFLQKTVDLLKNNPDWEDIVLPGYTHLQKAQPVTLSRHLGAYAEMFSRDIARIKCALDRIGIMPLGSGALAGNPFLTDAVRKELAADLGFADISQNSMDAVADRDFAVETLSALSLVMVHLSRLGEELVLWSTEEFGYIQISDAFTTGSSLMPQKKNPDIAELIRGKAGRVFGSLQAMLVTLKGLPLTYNRDLQEDKELLFDALDTVNSSLQVVNAMLPGITFKKDRMKANAGGFTLATRLADYLVKKNLPFREAHGIVGRVVAYCLENNKKEFGDLSVEEFKKISDVFNDDVYDFIKL
ncbi:MAG: argininosuccinate lyase [Candidatus Margulisiibacteriota bacterium]